MHQRFATMGKRWQGQTVAILASGPSLNQNAVDLLRNRLPVVAVNDAYRLAPRADLLYAADADWWEHHGYAADFAGERWTQNKGRENWPRRANEAGLNVIRSRAGNGVSTDPTEIYTGSNSSFQALNLAVLAGATRILFLGLDLSKPGGKSHFFGDHPGKLNRASPYHTFRRAFEQAAPVLEGMGVEVINCSDRSALHCFSHMTVEEALCESQ